MNPDAISDPPDAVVRVPGSKSLTQRAMVAAALASGTSRIRNALMADDTRHLAEGLGMLGAFIEQTPDGFIVTGTGGALKRAEGEALFLGNNGTALRFLTAVASLGRGRYVLTGDKRLCERPVGPLVEALASMGVDIRCTNHCPPVEIHANGLKGGAVTLTDIESSQYVSALLLCGPYTARGIDLSLEGSVVSAPYIDLTLRVMEAFGAKVLRTGAGRFQVGTHNLFGARDYVVEGDASSASYFYLAAALTGRKIRVRGITRQSAQGDIRLLDIFETLGCHVESGEDWVDITGGKLAQGDFTFDLGDMPDMVPTVGVLAAFRNGRTTLTNVAHLRIKESNRLAAMAAELGRAGIRARELSDGLEVEGGRMKPANIETYNDHRIAMSFAVASRVVAGISIYDRKCVDKSFPGFWKELAGL
ncbi:MAG TPA: 3-phosphoshikimate 1-carboxyvinyltransferase [Smithellaceae bacterium]|nr:3-phosphoshikimate 1-carboxyvinyltransferase [Smithellaceae bacterium]